MYEKGSMVATREAYGKALAELGSKDESIVVLDADLSKSTKTAAFASRCPERFFQMGISEQDLVCTAAGLALCGKKPFASTFAVFGSRAWEQIRNTVARGMIAVRLCFTHAGISVGEDGASAQANEDIAVMRAIPNMHVYVPADANETAAVIKYLCGDVDHPAYVRLGREKTEVVLPSDVEFVPGRSIVLREGDDVAIFACGLMVPLALNAAGDLEREGIHATVVNISSVKPIDTDTITQVLARCGCGVCAEEHSIIGGLGGAVAEVAAAWHPAPLEFVGIRDCFGESGKPAELLAKYGLTKEAIVDSVRKAMARKRKA